MNADDKPKKWREKLERISIDRIVELLLAVAVAWFAWRQYLVYDWQKKADISVHRPLVVNSGVSLSVPGDTPCRKDGDCKIRIEQDFQNVGSTPTKNLKIEVGYTYAHHSDYFVPSASDIRKTLYWTLTPAGGSIYPKGPYTPTSIDVNGIAVKHLIDSQDSLYIFSRVSYFDVFPEPIFHLVELCERVDNFGYVPDKDALQWGAINYACNTSKNQKWQCTDEECGTDYREMKKQRSEAR